MHNTFMVKRMINKKQGQGFTLTELMVVVAITGILASIAMPAYQDMMKTRRLEGAAAVLYAALQNVKAEAIKTNKTRRIIFMPNTVGSDLSTWCFGMPKTLAVIPTCDCTVDDNCKAGSVVKSTSFPDITVNFNNANTRTIFPLRGTSNDAGTVTFSNGSRDLKLVTTTLGRIKLVR